MKTYNEFSLPIAEISTNVPLAPHGAKPPYRVPAMGEIAQIPWNGYSIVSTFSGCGGSCLGFEMAGFRVLWANEFVPIAQETYRLNHPATYLDIRDIRTIEPQEILDTVHKRVGEIDLLEGSPPCASFSTAGKRHKTWGQVKAYSDTAQRSDDLFFEYARLLNGLQPKVFVAENVSGLVKGVAKGYFKEILRTLKACGYIVEARLLDAQWLGVPQMRQRLIFLGVRTDLVSAYSVRPVFPLPLPYRYSVRDALPQVVAIDGRTGESFRRVSSELDQPMNSITVRDITQTRYEVRAYRDKRGAFGNDGDITNQPAPTILSDSVGTHWIEKDRPLPTITQRGGDAGLAAVTYLTERRKFTIAELKRICAFPDDFQLIGTYAQQWERLGRAVPPLMMRAIAEIIRDHILRQMT